jgi:hypothetical protein
MPFTTTARHWEMAQGPIPGLSKTNTPIDTTSLLVQEELGEIQGL